MEGPSKISEYFVELQAGTIRYTAKVLEDIHKVVAEIDSGTKRVCNKIEDEWVVDGDVKKAILLYMNMIKSSVISIPFESYIPNVSLSAFYGTGDGQILENTKHCLKWYDKIPLKTSAWIFLKKFIILTQLIIHYKI